MNVPAYKIGSGECNNYPLLKHIASFGKPIILSTGMNTIDSVRKAVEIFDSAGVPYALLHTTNLYPTPPHLVRLGAMVELGKAFPERGDRPVRSHHRQHRLPRRRRARRVDPRASLHRSHVPPGPRHRLLDGREGVPRADRSRARKLHTRARRHEGSGEGRAGDDGLRVCDRRHDCADQGGRDADEAEPVGEAPGNRLDSGGAIRSRCSARRRARDLPADVHLAPADIG